VVEMLALRRLLSGYRAGAVIALGLLGLVTGLPAARAAELLLFETPGCPWCKLWDAEVRTAYLHSSEGQRAPLRRLDVSQARMSGVAFRAPVIASPTFVLADDGREVGRITGYAGADFFWGELNELFKRLDETQDR
jgi:hypothetical protein